MFYMFYMFQILAYCLGSWVAQPGRYLKHLKHHQWFTCFKCFNVFKCLLGVWAAGSPSQAGIENISNITNVLCDDLHVLNGCWLPGLLGAGLSQLCNFWKAFNVLTVWNIWNVWNTCPLLGWMAGRVDCVAALVGGGQGFPNIAIFQMSQIV